MSGPGFDVIGLALSMYLELRVTITKSASSPSHQQPDTPSPSSLNCSITYTGVSPTSIDLLPSSNLLTRSSLYLLRCHGLHAFPHPTSIHIHNPIPLGRGLGSSGAAVVAGILLGNLALTSHSPHLSLDKPRLLDYCLMIERHPDNVAAALYGGFVGTYLNELDPVDMARKEIPLSEVLPAPAGGVDTGLKPPEPPVGIGHFRRFRWAREIRAVAVIPDFEVSTARAREVLPGSYTRQDMVGSVFSCYFFYSPLIVCCVFFSFPRFSYQGLPFLPITSSKIQRPSPPHHHQTPASNYDENLDIQPPAPRPPHYRPRRLPP
jgi:homoserine kinase